MNYFIKSAINDSRVIQIFFIVVLITATICIIISTRLYKARIEEIKSANQNLMGKLEMYRAALILYIALCEGAGLFTAIVYFLTGKIQLLVVIAVIIAAMFLKRPEKLRIFNELQLSAEEQSELN